MQTDIQKLWDYVDICQYLADVSTGVEIDLGSSRRHPPGRIVPADVRQDSFRTDLWWTCAQWWLWGDDS